MSSNQPWTEVQMPDLKDQVAIVTGANSGIGYETARALAQKGATVVMVCRNLEKAHRAAEKIRERISPYRDSAGLVEVMELNLSDLESVHQFADAFQARYDRLHLLINNAGTMHPPYSKTAQGFEMQFGVNHLGHFALTGLLLGRLIHTPQSRVVTVSSRSHIFGRIDFDDLQWEKRRYQPNAAYGQSKLANLLFTYELQRKLTAAKIETLSVAAHPGWTATNLQDNSPGIRFLNRFFSQQPVMGALPTLYAATAAEVRGGEYYGPSDFMELAGYPKRVQSNARSRDEKVAAELWEVSETLTGVRYGALLSIASRSSNRRA
jgi:NAD(P)-dependent dehydrogenase (short-subunit alcohol dehydrogenase family)